MMTTAAKARTRGRDLLLGLGGGGLSIAIAGFGLGVGLLFGPSHARACDPRHGCCDGIVDVGARPCESRQPCAVQCARVSSGSSPRRRRSRRRGSSPGG
jgi:hypothetical protein